MGRKNRTGTAILRASIALAEGKAPTSFVLLKAGVNSSDHYGEGDGGNFVFDEVAAAMVMQSFSTDGRPRLYGDWNHGSLQPRATREQGAACCSFVPVIDIDGNLIADDIEWTDEGRADVESGAYNLFSPAFAWGFSGEGDGFACRPTKLINFALVNLAGLKDIQPLMAAASAAIAAQENDMEFEKLYNETKAVLETTKASLETANARIRSLEGNGSQIAAMSMAIGLKPEAPDAERVTMLSGLVALRADVLKTTGAETPEAARAAITGLVALRSQVFSITGTTAPEAAVASLQVMKETSERVVELEAGIERDKVAALTSEWAGVWTGAVDAGKVTPADVEARKSSLLAVAGGKVTRAAIDAAKMMVGGSAPIVEMGAGHGQPASGASLLTEEDREVWRQMGGPNARYTLEDVAKFKARQVAPAGARV